MWYRRMLLSHLVMSNSLHPRGLSPPGSSVHGTLQAGTLEWVARPSSSGPSQLNLAWAGGFSTTEPPGKPHGTLSHKKRKPRVCNNTDPTRNDHTKQDSQEDKCLWHHRVEPKKDTNEVKSETERD